MTASQSIDFASFDPEAQPRGSKRAYYLDVAELPSGDTLRLAALVAKGAEPGPTLVALGGVHGDEYEGPHAARLAFDALDTGRMAGSFVGVPQCNVPAFAAGTRTSPIDGLNLARIFPGDAQGTITERIAYNLGEHVIAGCDFLIDLHSSGAPTAIAPLIGYYRGDDDHGRKSLEAALAFGMPVLWGHPDVGPGRTVSYAHERQIPWLYTESVGGGWLNQRHARMYADGVINVLKLLGVVEGEPNRKPPTHHLVGDSNNDVTAQTTLASGYFVSEANVLDRVEKGDMIGRVVGLAGEVKDEIVAQSDGVIVLLRANPTVAAGEWICVVTGEIDVEP